MSAAAPASTLTVGLLQMTAGIEPAGNALALESGVRDLAAAGAQLILTPEMTGVLDGNKARLLANTRTEAEDDTLALARGLAAELKVWLLIGSLALKASGGTAAAGDRLSDMLVNRQFLIDDHGVIRAWYDKIHLFDVELPNGERYRESAAYLPGERAVVTATPWGRLGHAICYDLRFPHLFRALAQAGAAILVVPAAFTRTTGQAHWHTLLKARAIETGCFVLAPAQTGHHADGRDTYGHSLVVAPWGEVLADGGEAPGGLVATLDLSQVGVARGRIPALRHDRGFALVEV